MASESCGISASMTVYSWAEWESQRRREGRRKGIWGINVQTFPSLIFKFINLYIWGVQQTTDRINSSRVWLHASQSRAKDKESLKHQQRKDSSVKLAVTCSSGTWRPEVQAIPVQSAERTELSKKNSVSVQVTLPKWGEN